MTLLAWIHYCKGDKQAPRKYKGVNMWNGHRECAECFPLECSAFADGFGLACPAMPKAMRWHFVPDPVTEADQYHNFIRNIPLRKRQLKLF